MKKREPTKLFIQGLVSGSSDHWNEFVDRFSRLIYKTFHASSFRFSKEEIDDLFHDFMVQVIKNDYRKIKLFEGCNNCSLQTYLRKVAVNLAIDRQKSLIRKRMLSLNIPSPSDDEKEVGRLIEAPENQPAAPLLEEEESRLFLQGLYNQDPAKLLVVVLIVYHRINREHLAEIVGTTRQNIDVIFKRTRDRIRDDVAKIAAHKKRPSIIDDEPPGWNDSIISARDRIVAMDRAPLLQACLDVLDLPDELLTAILFINAPALRPTPDRLAVLFNMETNEISGLVENVFNKLGIP